MGKEVHGKGKSEKTGKEATSKRKPQTVTFTKPHKKHPENRETENKNSEENKKIKCFTLTNFFRN